MWFFWPFLLNVIFNMGKYVSFIPEVDGDDRLKTVVPTFVCPFLATI